MRHILLGLHGVGSVSGRLAGPLRGEYSSGVAFRDLINSATKANCDLSAAQQSTVWFDSTSFHPNYAFTIDVSAALPSTLNLRLVAWDLDNKAYDESLAPTGSELIQWFATVLQGFSASSSVTVDTRQGGVRVGGVVVPCSRKPTLSARSQVHWLVAGKFPLHGLGLLHQRLLRRCGGTEECLARVGPVFSKVAPFRSGLQHLLPVLLDADGTV